MPRNQPLDGQAASSQIYIACRQYQIRVGRLLISGEPNDFEPRKQQLRNELVSELMGIIDRSET